MNIEITLVKPAHSRQGDWNLRAHVDARIGDFRIRRAFLYERVDGDQWRIAVGSGSEGGRRITLSGDTPTRAAFLAAAVKAWRAYDG